MGYSISRKLGTPYSVGESGTIYSCNKSKVGKITFYNGLMNKVNQDTFEFIPESDIEVSLQYDLQNAQEKFIDKVSGAKIIGSLLNGVASLTDSSTYSSHYSQFPVTSNKIEASISSSLVMNFKFGYQQLWNAQSEVVNPVLSIVKKYLVQMGSKTEKDPNGGYKINGPWLSEGELIMRAARGMINASLGTAKQPSDPVKSDAQIDAEAEEAKKKKPDTSDSTSTGGEGTQTPTEGDQIGEIVDDLGNIDFNDDTSKDGLATKLINALDELAGKMYAAYDSFIRDKSGDKGIFFDLTIGGVTYTNLFASGISWKFDTSEVDVNGRPLSGTVTLSGIKFVMLPRNDYFVTGNTVGGSN